MHFALVLLFIRKNGWKPGTNLLKGRARCSSLWYETAKRGYSMPFINLSIIPFDRTRHEFIDKYNIIQPVYCSIACFLINFVAKPDISRKLHI
jgi:hypothetical protein